MAAKSQKDLVWERAKRIRGKNKKYCELASILKKDNFTKQDVVFILVEFRKIIENKRLDVGVLKFYCDWVVHRQKDYVSANIKRVIKQMYQNILEEIRNPLRIELRQKIMNFIYFKQLKQDLIFFCSNLRFPMDFIRIKKRWISFIVILIKILEEQPIINPIPEIKSIEFIPSAPKAVICKFFFSKPIKVKGRVYSYYQIMNHYGLYSKMKNYNYKQTEIGAEMAREVQK